MTNLTNAQIGQVYGDYLTTTNSGLGLSTVLNNLQDGLGNNSPITIATNAVNFTRGANTFQLDGIALIASATTINNLCSNTPSFPAGYPVQLPVGTTATRPASPQNGMIWYNSTIPGVEAYVNGAWVTL